MKNIRESSVTKENLINEYKGHLFEYAVALQLATLHKCEGKFLDEISPAIRRLLSSYEQEVRCLKPDLIPKLFRLAFETASFIEDHLGKSIKSLLLLGKEDLKEHIESDILLNFVDGSKSLPLSLKLCKKNSFVNTKNAGLQSFLYQYFPFPHVKELQERVNQEVGLFFYEMAYELYKKANLTPPSQGGFDDRWSTHYSELPGQLEAPFQEIVYRYYDRVKEVLYKAFLILQEESLESFRRSLVPLWGLDEIGSDLVQIKCFHEDHNFCGNVWGDRFFVERELASWKMAPYQEGISSFEIKGLSSALQIRVKPMNRFTVLGLKVNCSVKLFSLGGPA